MPQRYKKIKISGRTYSFHRYLMEQHLGRKLTAGEVVHHKNGDRLDNRLENLEVLSHQEHSEHHNQKHALTKKCEVCGSEFTPHPTKRERAKTCSWTCRSELISRSLLTAYSAQEYRDKIRAARRRTVATKRAGGES